MATYRVVVTQVHPEGDLKKNICKEVFSKTCLYVGEANDLKKEKIAEYNATPESKLYYVVERLTVKF
jgi:hypothetical protein